MYYYEHIFREENWLSHKYEDGGAKIGGLVRKFSVLSKCHSNFRSTVNENFTVSNFGNGEKNIEGRRENSTNVELSFQTGSLKSVNF